MAYEGLVPRQIFQMNRPFATVSGGEVRALRLGYRTLGTLNDRRDNAILIPPLHTGVSHFAGRFKEDDKYPGHWDPVVGPGLPIDTDKYFLIGIDGLCGFNDDGVTITTGPSSLDPLTDRPYGMTFPPIEIRDFVNVQKALLESLGIKKLHSVVGASMGGLQALEWAAAYPDLVDKVVAIVASGRTEPYSAAKAHLTIRSVMDDPDWNNGNYDASKPPSKGLSAALGLLTLDLLSPRYVENSPNVEKWLDRNVLAKVRCCDANNFIYTQNAYKNFKVGGKADQKAGLSSIRAKLLLVSSHVDFICFPESVERTRDLLRTQGNEVDYMVLEGAMGHLNCMFSIIQAGDKISRLLSG